MQVTDSRRLTGPSLWLDRPGAVLEVAFGEAPGEAAVVAWRQAARRLLDGVGWGAEEIAVRTFAGGACLAFTAPVDALYAATELNEAAWEAAVEPATFDEAAAVARLRARIAEEQNPALLDLRAAAQAHGLTFLADDEHVSLGTGHGSQTWPASEVPPPGAVAWENLWDVPVVLVTGTNGKSTTVRLLARIFEAAGTVAGVTSTDFIRAGREIIDRGDFSGPSGARTLLRHPRVEAALLEVARGGLLRRGLAVERAAAALVTNVAEDHLGEYGILTLGDLIETKLTVAKAVAHGGLLVLNADDAGLVAHAAPGEAEVVWFSLDADNAVVQRHRAGGGAAALLRDGTLVFARGGEEKEICAVEAIPFTLAGAARHNVANALGASAVALGLGLSAEAVAEGLRRFRNDPQDNPGRTNFFEVGGVQVVVDFAHNPHGVTAVAETIRRMPARRRLVTLGQAGDRSDDDIRGLVRAALTLGPDHAVVMELPGYERGRAPGAVADVILDELGRHGLSGDTVERVETNLEAVEAALRWAAPGDLLLLLVYSQREAIFRRLVEAGATVPQL